jgi:hypothetical protein
LLNVELVANLEYDQVLQILHFEFVLLLDLGLFELQFFFDVRWQVDFEFGQQVNRIVGSVVFEVRGIQEAIVQSVGIRIGITKGLLNFEYVNHGDSFIIETVPFAVFIGLDVTVVMPVVGGAVMNKHCVQFIHERALL